MLYHPKLRCDVDLRTMKEHCHNQDTKPITGVRSGVWFTYIVMIVIAASSTPVQAQLFARSTIITNARIVTMNGSVIEKGSILIQGNTIKAVGKDVKAPFLANTIDAGGKTITPGLIDAWSALGNLSGSNSADPKSKAWDSFDLYNRDDFREALRNGVTTIYLGAYGSEGVTGTGSVIQLAPGKMNKAGKLLKEESSLCIQFGSNQPAIARLKTYNSLRKQFKTAAEYRESLEDYDEELKEYLEKLEERKKEKDKESKSEDKKEDSKDKKDKPKNEPKPDEKKPDKKDPPSSVTTTTDNDQDFAKRNAKPEKNSTGKNGKKDGEKDKEEDKDELKKPKKPSPDRNSEILLKAIDHEMPIRVEAHRSEDILNAIELSKEFGLDLLLEGATDAYLIADEIADANIPVILGSVIRHGIFMDDEYRRHSENAASKLDKADVLWTVGSGANYNASSRFVAMNAQLASAHGVKKHWLETVTSQAAKILEISDRVGRIAPGMSADLVIWSADPDEAAATVNQVYIGGQLVYESKQGGK